MFYWIGNHGKGLLTIRIQWYEGHLKSFFLPQVLKFSQHSFLCVKKFSSRRPLCKLHMFQNKTNVPWKKKVFCFLYGLLIETSWFCLHRDHWIVPWILGGRYQPLDLWKRSKEEEASSIAFCQDSASFHFLFLTVESTSPSRLGTAFFLTFPSSKLRK